MDDDLAGHRRQRARLSGALATSMIGDNRPVTLKVVGDGGALSSRQAESIGLITTELVMNCFKHAFPRADTKGQIINHD
jgi:two-component sensor histidine kinase